MTSSVLTEGWPLSWSFPLHLPNNGLCSRTAFKEIVQSGLQTSGNFTAETKGEDQGGRGAYRVKFSYTDLLWLIDLWFTEQFLYL